MASIFLSHASQDTELASDVAQWLLEAGHDVFLDQDVTHGITVGDDWEDRELAGAVADEESKHDGDTKSATPELVRARGGERAEQRERLGAARPRIRVLEQGFPTGGRTVRDVSGGAVHRR